MKQMYTWTDVAVLCTTLWITVTADKIRLCFNGTEVDSAGSVTLACPDGQAISIDEALFGRNKWGACVISDGDCVDKTRIFTACENLNNCTRSFKTYSTACGGYSTVMFISYTCFQLQVNPVLTSIATSTSTSTTKKNERSPGLQIHLTAKPTETASRNNGDDMSETGLIVGCVVAAVVTVIALVIAITMVVRRLMQKSTPDDDGVDSIESKSNCPCFCNGCFHCFTTSKSVHQHKLTATDKTYSTSTASRHGSKQNSMINKKMSADKGNKLTSVGGNVESSGQGPLSEQMGLQNISLSNQVFTADTTKTSQQEREDTKMMDSSFRIKPRDVKEEVYCNQGMEDHLNEDSENRKHNYNPTEWKSNTISEKMISESGYHSGLTSTRNENVNNQPATIKVPKYDAIAIPNTQRGTTC
uniref:SUEL-type lectin domain-containing protein n=1 Tax=Arion vulgaris TaxID=1028688 RepID=A0A0B7A2E7_9EUPU